MHASISGRGLMNPQLDAPARIVFPLSTSLPFPSPSCLIAKINKWQLLCSDFCCTCARSLTPPDPPATPLAVCPHHLEHVQWAPLYKLYLVNYRQCGRVSPTCDLWIFMSWSTALTPRRVVWPLRVRAVGSGRLCSYCDISFLMFTIKLNVH